MILLLAACRSSVPVVVPDVGELAPLETTNLAPEVEATSDDAFPEGIETASGERDDALYWAHAKANVAADLPTVWACFQDVDVVVDRRAVDEWTWEEAVEDGFDFSATIHNTVHDIITVDYDLLWLHEVQGGTAENPDTVVMQWTKTDGSNVIQLLEGSAVLTVAEDGVTRIELIEHLQATLRDEGTIVSYLTDLVDSVTACAHGDDLPSY